MKRKKVETKKTGVLSTPASVERQPLIRALVAQAVHRGDTLHVLAKALGVTYARLSQWRRNESDFANASSQVIERAAAYLGIPAVLAMVMAKRIGLAQLHWPARGKLDERVEAELERLRRDPFLGGFVPAELATASPAVQFFVVFLFHELVGPDGRHESLRWLSALHRVAAGDMSAQLELDSLRERASTRVGMF